MEPTPPENGVPVVDRGGALASARALTTGLERHHRVDLPRDWRRRALPSRSAKPADVRIAACPGGVWLDVSQKAGVLFTPEQWAQLTLEAVALLVELGTDATPQT